MSPQCQKCELPFILAIGKFFQNNDAAIDIFRNHGVLPPADAVVKCERCFKVCTYRKDQHVYRCTRTPCRGRNCGYSISEWRGSVLDNMRIQPWKLMTVMAHWSDKNNDLTSIQRSLRLSKATLISWRSLCSQVCMSWLNRQDQIGGPGVVVEVDETHLVYGKSVDVWIFGGIERESKKKFLIPVEDRGADTLLELVKTFIKPHSTVYTDGWRSYNRLCLMGYDHSVVNHSVGQFVVGDCHIQTVERLWSDLKSWVVRPGMSAEHVQEYLARYLFLKDCTPETAVHCFLKEVGRVHPPSLS